MLAKRRGSERGDDAAAEEAAAGAATLAGVKILDEGRARRDEEDIAREAAPAALKLRGMAGVRIMATTRELVERKTSAWPSLA